MMYSLNQEHHGVELFFDSKPEPIMLDALKANGWRWNGIKKCWYNKQSEKTIELAKSLTNGKETTTTTEAKPAVNTSPAYHKKVSDYISLETFEKRITELYHKGRHNSMDDTYKNQAIKYALSNYDSSNEYSNLSKNIRQMIVAKSIKMDPARFEERYQAVWDELPTIEGLKPGKKYSATWGYDQTNITTATHYGKAFGLDVLITGGFGHGEVLLKRIDKDGRFSEGCMYFSPNTYTEKEIQETNEYASYYGH